MAEWSKTEKAWRDECLVKPLLVGALLDAAKADAAIVQGLKAKGDPEIGRIRAEVEAKGEVKAIQAAVLAALAARGLEVSGEVRDAVAACDDPATLELEIAQLVKAGQHQVG